MLSQIRKGKPIIMDKMTMLAYEYPEVFGRISTVRGAATIMKIPSAAPLPSDTVVMFRRIAMKK
jgi:hypothetical protein